MEVEKEKEFKDESNSKNVNKNEDNQERSSLFMGQKQRRRSSATKIFLGDNLNLISDVKVLKIMQKFGDKSIHFSGIVVKMNKRNKMQDRILLITDTNIYNLDPSPDKFIVKRKIPITSLGSIITSTFEDNFFALNVPSEYDYLLISNRKTEIITTIVVNYWKLTQGKHLQVKFQNQFSCSTDPDVPKEITFKKMEGGVITVLENSKQGPFSSVSFRILNSQ